MKTTRIIAAFVWYAAVGLLVGVALEGVGISLTKGDFTLDQFVTARRKEARQQYKQIMANTAVAAKDVGFWVMPVLLAAGLGIFFARTEHSDGTAFHFDNRCERMGDSWGDD